MQLPELLYMIFQLSCALDSGKCPDISISQVEEEIRSGNLISFLQNRFTDEIDLQLFKLKPSLEREYIRKMQTMLELYEGREYDKFGVQNSGLCLLIAWNAEIIQHEHLWNEEL